MTQILAPQSCCDPVTPVNSPESQCSSRTLPFVLATSLKWQTSATAQPSRLSDEFSSRNVPVRHGSCPMRTEMERTDLSNSRQRAAKFEGAIWLVVSVLSRYGRSGCGIWRSVLPNYITRLQEKMNDPDKLFILHPNIWTTLEHCSRCAAKAKIHLPLWALSNEIKTCTPKEELTTECFCWLKHLFFLLVIGIFLMRSKTEFQLSTK